MKILILSIFTASLMAQGPAGGGVIGGGSSSGGTPASPTGSVQYNNAGSFGGVTNTVKSTDGDSLKFTGVPDPTTVPTVALAGVGAGNVDNGAHCYAYSYGANYGYTNWSGNGAGYATVTVANKAVNGKVNVTIPASADSRVTKTVIFRTQAGVACSNTPAVFYSLVTVFTNGGLYLDNVSDASIGAGSTVTTGGYGSNTSAVFFGPNDSPVSLGDQGVDANYTFLSLVHSSLTGAAVMAYDATGAKAPIQMSGSATDFLNGAGAFTAAGPLPAGSAGTVQVTDGATSLQAGQILSPYQPTPLNILLPCTASSLTGWTVSGDGTGYSIVGGAIHFAGGNTNKLVCDATVIQNTYYKFAWTVTSLPDASHSFYLDLGVDCNSDCTNESALGANTYTASSCCDSGATVIEIQPDDSSSMFTVSAMTVTGAFFPTIITDAANPSAVVIGGLSGAGGTSDIVIGGNARSSSVSGLGIALGNGDVIVSAGGGTTSGNGGVAIGTGNVAAQRAVAIGHLTHAAGTYDIAIGDDTETGIAGESVAIGSNSHAGAGSSVAIGFGATTGDLHSGVAVGKNADANHQSIVIGQQSTGSGLESTVIGGRSVSGSAAVVSVVIGNEATVSVAHTFVMGGPIELDSEITDWFGGTIGESATPLSIHAADVSGTNVAGSDITLAGGRSTGNVAGGNAYIDTSPAGSTGAVQNAGVHAVQVDSAGHVFLLLIPTAANCSGQPSKSVIATTGTGVLVQCP